MAVTFRDSVLVDGRTIAYLRPEERIEATFDEAFVYLKAEREVVAVPQSNVKQFTLARR